MRKLAKAAVAVVLLWIVVTNLFVSAMWANETIKRGGVHWTFQAPLYVGAGVGLVADMAFNLSVGTVAFRSPPQELLFTGRLKRELENDGWRRERAQWWCTQLHNFDPAHCGGWVPSELP